MLARAEWEERLNTSQEEAESFKEQLNQYRESVQRSNSGSAAEDYMQQARQFSASLKDGNGGLHGSSGGGGQFHSPFASARSQNGGRAQSVASLGSGLAIHAKKLVSSINDFNCNALNERNGMGGSGMGGVGVSDEVNDLQMHNSHSHGSTPKSASSSRRHHHSSSSQHRQHSPQPDRYRSAPGSQSRHHTSRRSPQPSASYVQSSSKSHTSSGMDRSRPGSSAYCH